MTTMGPLDRFVQAYPVWNTFKHLLRAELHDGYYHIKYKPRNTSVGIVSDDSVQLLLNPGDVSLHP